MIKCRALSESEIESIISHLSLRDRAWFILGIKTGFRISEILSIRVKDIQQYGAIVDTVTIASRYMKGKAKGRSVVIHQDAKDIIQALIAIQGLAPNDYLFKSTRCQDQPITRIQAYRALKKAIGEAQISGHVATHSMRKSFATKVYNKLNKDIVKTQKAIGHASITSTIAYLAVDQDEIDSVILD